MNEVPWSQTALRRFRASPDPPQRPGRSNSVLVKLRGPHLTATSAGDRGLSEHDETTYENPLRVVLVAMITGTTRRGYGLAFRRRADDLVKGLPGDAPRVRLLDQVRAGARPLRIRDAAALAAWN